MVEYWTVGLDKEVTHFIASLLREILPIYHYSIFLERIIPSFHYSNIPIAQRSGAKFSISSLYLKSLQSAFICVQKGNSYAIKIYKIILYVK